MKLNTVISYLFYWEEPHVFGHIKAYKTTHFKSAEKKNVKVLLLIDKKLIFMVQI